MSEDNDWLVDLPGIRQLFLDGVAFIRRKALDFKGPGWVIQDNPSTGRTEVEIDSEALAQQIAAALAEDADFIQAVATAVSELE